MMKYKLDAAGRLLLIDPDDQDDLALVAGALEGRRSPDHFPALLLYWWIAGSVSRGIRPKAGAPANIPPGIKRRANLVGPLAARWAGLSETG